jgi:LytS/YehU family sensor histidine kinase
MLRYQLYECGGNETDIEKEINYIRNYVLLQKSRRDESLAVSLEIDDTISGFRIAPLLFVTYIENSFKYVGNDTDRENAVLISMTREQEIVKFRCFNTKHANGTNQMERRGIGLTNAKKRLELLYPEKYALNIIDEQTFFEVNLNITIK